MLIKEDQLVFSKVLLEVSNPNGNYKENFRVSDVYTCTVKLRGYPPGKTQALISSLAT